jgi:hypothetical protein
MKRALSLLALGVLLVPALATAQASKPPKKERNRISQEELAQSIDRYAVLYDAIRQMRPHFLEANRRGPRSTGISSAATEAQGAAPGRMASAGSGSGAVNFPTVYVDGVRSGELDILKTINTSGVVEVRYYSANEAETEFGPRNEGGVIAVKLVKAEKP